MRGEETRKSGRAHFYYDREDRVRGLSAYVRERQEGKTRSIFRKNRSLAIILIDLGVILLIVAIMFFFVRLRAVEELYDGLTVDGDAYFIEGRIFVTLVVERTGSSEYAGTARAIFSVPDGNEYSIESPLPSDTGDTERIRGVVTTDRAPAHVDVMFIVGDQRRTLEIAVENR